MTAVIRPSDLSKSKSKLTDNKKARQVGYLRASFLEDAVKRSEGRPASCTGVRMVMVMMPGDEH